MSKKTTHIPHHCSALSAAACALLLIGAPTGANAAVSFIGKETSTSSQTISPDVLDFFTYDTTEVVVQKSGGPVSWAFSNGASFGGSSEPMSISWSGGDTVASGTSLSTVFFPFGPGYGDQVASGSVSFTVTQTVPTVGLTLFTMPVANSGSMSYDFSLLVNGTEQYKQSGATDVSSEFDIEILDFQISDLAQGDVVTFLVDNVSGDNDWRNFAFLGGSLNAIPEPSSALLSGLAFTAMLMRRRRA